MYVNILKAQVTNHLPNPEDINDFEFWTYYLKLLSVQRDGYINRTEREAIAFLLSNDLKTSWFKKPNVDEMCLALDTNYNNLRATLNRLIKKGLVQKTEIRGDYILCSPLLKAKEQMDTLRERSGGVVNFIFPLKIS